MSRQHVVMIAETSATAFLQSETQRPETARGKFSRVRSKRAGAASTTTT